MKSLLIIWLTLITLPSFARCSDYSSAAEVVRAYKNGETDLDRDNDCYACESTFNAYVCGNDAAKQKNGSNNRNSEQKAKKEKKYKI